MGPVATLVTTVAATAGAIALYRFVDRKRRSFEAMVADVKRAAEGDEPQRTIELTQDPESGVYRAGRKNNA